MQTIIVLDPAVSNGDIRHQNLLKCLMTKDDLMSDVRLRANEDNFENIKDIYREIQES
ncbi:uncharacterized membrane protein YcaP (DUF421 family) [Mucilaginibacter sp. UYP25]|uniref:hypothetical protein n=1 Tax=unclassified Mucilaginibacter TaxID=2617802 RepID=UPI003390B78C